MRQISFRSIVAFLAFDGERISKAGTDTTFVQQMERRNMRDYNDAKQMAKSLRESLAEKGVDVSHGETLEIVAKQFGFDTWNVLSSKMDAPQKNVDAPFTIKPGIPILRIFDVAKAKEFYTGFLGFTVDWEHTFGENFPIYLQASWGDLILHLSEHVGDASPAARVFIRTKGIEAFHTNLIKQDYRYMKPGLERQQWGLEVNVIDPFNNRLTFCEQRH